MLQCSSRERCTARSLADTKIYTVRCKMADQLELLRNVERIMMRQHHTARTDTDIFRMINKMCH